MKYQRARVTLALLVGVPLYVILSTGCASAPKGPEFLGCSLDQECVVLQIRNDAWSLARIYINGGYLSSVEGKSSGTVAIPRWRLDADRCAVVKVRLIAQGEIGTDKQCVRVGGHFTLDIFEHLRNTVFTGWAAGR